jgi:hypothetical protein
MGTTAEYGRIVIRTSENSGRTWSAPRYLTEDTGYHTAPVPMAIRGDRIYRAFEFHPEGKWGFFEAFMMWAPLESDLTNPASWSFSNHVKFPVGEQGNAWLEGNALVAPDGSIVDMLRVNNLQHAAILKLTGSTLTLDRFVEFPGGATKFTIRFDAKTKLYWTLSNPALESEPDAASAPAHVRNTLALMSSPDLIHWTPRSIVLHHENAKKYAFQYVDWQFDGQDLIVASRTAFEDGVGGPHRFHDANYLTFHRIANFRKLGTVKLADAPSAVSEPLKK